MRAEAQPRWRDISELGCERLDAASRHDSRYSMPHADAPSARSPPRSARRGSKSASPTSRRSTSTPSSMRPTRRCSAAAASTAPSIAPPGRNSWPNAGRSAAATPARPRSPAAIGSRQSTSSMRSGRSGAAAGNGEDELLASCYRAALSLAPSIGLASIAFPAISTGVYRFPPERAARIAVGTVAAEIANAPRDRHARGVLLLLAGGGGAPSRGIRRAWVIA